MKLTSNADKLARRVAAWTGSIGPEAARATLEAATVVTAAGKQEAPSRSGRLRRSIAYRVGGEARYVVSPNVPYAPAVHNGSVPHTILPRVKKALWWKGAPHPLRVVHHPGTKANAFMTRALEQSRPRISQIADRLGTRIITRQG